MHDQSIDAGEQTKGEQEMTLADRIIASLTQTQYPIHLDDVTEKLIQDTEEMLNSAPHIIHGELNLLIGL